MKLERSNVDFYMWRKKVDSSLFNYKGTSIPNWACKMWQIDKNFINATSKKQKESVVRILFEKVEYEGWLTVVKKNRTPVFRLWFSDYLLYRIKDVFLMSYMRDIESRLRSKIDRKKIEDEIPFWEFLDIEFNIDENEFIFTSYYTQKPSFPELFSRLIGSPVLHKIDDEISKTNKDRIYKQDWKPRQEFETEIGAENVIYTLLDTKNKLIYVGEAKKLISRFRQGHSVITNWDFYRYELLPKSMMRERVTLERMMIRFMATLFPNNKNIKSMELSKYKLVNDKIDKY